MNLTYMDILIEPACEYFALYTQCIAGLRYGAAQQRKKVRTYQNVLDLKMAKHSNIAVIVSSNIEWTQQTTDQLREDGYKMILVGASFESIGNDFSGPTLDRQALVRKMLAYFISAGRTNIACIGSLTSSFNDQSRIQAFLSIGKALGLSVSIHDIYDADQGLGLCIERFLDKAYRYDGALCVNDMVAIELLAQAKQRGIIVPEQLYVAGSGNFRMGLAVTPTLTTTTLDYYQMGVLATDIWHLMQKYKDSDRIQISMPLELIIRESTAGFEPALTSEQDLCMSAPKPMVKTDNAAAFLRKLENCLMTCDPLDIKILSGIYANESIASMAQRLFVSMGTINYRLKQLYTRTNIAQKNVLMQQLRKYFSSVAALESMLQTCSDGFSKAPYNFESNEAI